MAFLGKTDASADKAAKTKKSGLTVGSLFNPNIGASLRPLAETGHMLVTLIAAIFAANGLFPRNHPALHNVPGARVTLSEVLSVGWQNVTFTRDTLPRTLIFFAVVLSLGFTALAIFLAVLQIFFIHPAHAQVTCEGATCFTAPGDTGAGGTDLAINWLNWLFLNDGNAYNMGTLALDPITGLSQTMPVASGNAGNSIGANAVQGALISALGLYSYCMLVIGAVVLFYHLATMVTETAHHGVVMGRRANQVWAPIRLCAAIGLLVPIGAAGFGPGLNSGQYIILQTAKWGTGLASNVWALFVRQLGNSSNFRFVTPNAPYNRGAVTDTYFSGACIRAYNGFAEEAGEDLRIRGPITDPYGNLTYGKIINNPDGSYKVSYTPESPTQTVLAADNDLCGYYVLPILPPAPTSVGTNAARAAEQQLSIDIAYAMYALGPGTAWGDMVFNTLDAGWEDMKWFIPPPAGGEGGGAPTISDNLEPLISDYLADISDRMDAIMSAGLAWNMALIEQETIDQGWASAATWFNTIARVQAGVSNLPRDMMPKTAPPQVDVIVRENPALAEKSLEASTRDAMASFQQWVYMGFGWNDPVLTLPGGTATQQQIQLAAVGTLQQGAVNKAGFMDDIFEVVDQIAAINGVWRACVESSAGGTAQCDGSTGFTLGVQFSTNNPIAEISNLGHANINTAYDLYDEYIMLQAAASAGRNLKDFFSTTGMLGGIGLIAKLAGLAAQMGGEAAGAIGNIMGGAVIVFFAAGFLLAYFLPLIPFYRFFFATLSWFLSMFEAIVAVPLIALAHLTPEGEGFMGEKAKAAYFFIFNLFLKPVLMVFGLVTGYLIFCLAVSMMNLLFLTAVSGAGGVSNGHFTLGRLVYSILYVVILYLCCNKCFQLIDWLPDHCLRWCNQQGLHHAQMGEPTEVGNYMAGAAGLAEKHIVDTTGKFMSGPMGAVAMGAMANNPRMEGIMNRATSNLGNQIGRATGSQGAGNAFAGALGATQTGAKSAVGAAEKGFQAIMGAGAASKDAMGEFGKAYQESMHSQSAGGGSPNILQAQAKGFDAAAASLDKSGAHAAAGNVKAQAGAIRNELGPQQGGTGQQPPQQNSAPNSGGSGQRGGGSPAPANNGPRAQSTPPSGGQPQANRGGGSGQGSGIPGGQQTAASIGGSGSAGSGSSGGGSGFGGGVNSTGLGAGTNAFGTTATGAKGNAGDQLAAIFGDDGGTAQVLPMQQPVQPDDEGTA